MPKAVLRYREESFETLLNRFKRQVDKSNIMEDYFKHEFYEKPSKRRAREKAAAVKRQERLTQDAENNRKMV